MTPIKIAFMFPQHFLSGNVMPLGISRENGGFLRHGRKKLHIYIYIYKFANR